MTAKITARRQPARFYQVGTTLVEAMIAMTIGLMLLATLSQVFVSNSMFRRELDRSSRLVENASFAMERLGSDLRSAGFVVGEDSGMTDWNDRFANGRARVERASYMRIAVARI